MSSRCQNIGRVKLRRRRFVAPASLASFLLLTLTVYPVAVSGAATASASAPVSGAATARPSAAVPTVTGPVPGTPVLSGTSFNLSQVGYEQSEFFLSGTADAYAPRPTLR